MTMEELKNNNGSIFDWYSQIGAHCSNRGERWTCTEEGFLSICKMLESSMIVDYYYDNLLYVKLEKIK